MLSRTYSAAIVLKKYTYSEICNNSHCCPSAPANCLSCVETGAFLSDRLRGFSEPIFQNVLTWVFTESLKENLFMIVAKFMFAEYCASLLADLIILLLMERYK